MRDGSRKSFKIAPTPGQDDNVVRLHGGKPCPARGLAVLGFPEPTLIPCGEVEGHAGPHRYHMEWRGDHA